MRHATRPSPAARPALAVLGLALLGLALLGGCADTSLELQDPARILYFEAEALENQGLHSDAIAKLQNITAQYPGTRLAAFAFLKLADIYALQESWADAEAHYRQYLAANPGSHLTSYTLFRLLDVNDRNTYTGLFFKEREVDRGTSPNKKIILDYKRFLLLYPNSVYLPQIEHIYLDARATLASHELQVGDFYYKRGQYNAAVGRYWYLLRTYPEYPYPEAVLSRLIRAYRRNQQPEQAQEMFSIYRTLFGERGNAVDPVEN
ncbi:MAG: outer membrane protein assembly factor BamD [Candidatus Lambdaproteobacteria bacterium]|nr:outer membrane protein assembly factor BamD [Candidatus Lambdaproteobacteria bacterium]